MADRSSESMTERAPGAARSLQAGPQPAPQAAGVATRDQQAPRAAVPVPPGETELPAPADILADDLLDLPTALMEPLGSIINTISVKFFLMVHCSSDIVSN